MKEFLTTERLFLYIISQNDISDVYQTMNSRHTAEIISFLSWPMTVEQAASWCAKAEDGARKGNDFIFLARHKENGAPVGCIGLHHIDEKLKNAETGYWVAENWQR